MVRDLAVTPGRRTGRVAAMGTELGGSFEGLRVTGVLRDANCGWSVRNPINLFPPAGQPVLEMHLVHGERPYMGFWFEDSSEFSRYVRLFDIPGTLSGDILRLERNLPLVPGHFEIEGDVARTLERCPDYPPLVKDDFDDVNDLVAQLPVVNIDLSKHFVKKPKYGSEIKNFPRCQGGSCLGAVLSEHLLVFDKLQTQVILASFSCLLACLHSLSIVHRIDNCLFTLDGSRLVICDLGSRRGQRAAPEITPNGRLDSGWNARSDIYDISNCIKCMAIVNACMRERPDNRPTLLQLRAMVECIAAGVE
ncbi:hypothetical protein B0T24DRAFT_655964 [Lasiosphaeria ovina]|uniref:Protein kinase domain-containing protein n=1 Tax=Lasiosphaeria ovina TaxID=92902 RepID=A0AAE0NFV5_9PEZI|nr:hypothetical protein B0T24DRAFT_655964 [Lasiosphaeria ovina]